MSKDLLAYRIPNKPSVEQLGSFKTMNNSKKKSIGFILTNFYGNNQFIFESNNQDIFEPSEYAIHLNKNQPTSISKERYIEQGKLALEMMPKPRHVHHESHAFRNRGAHQKRLQKVHF